MENYEKPIELTEDDLDKVTGGTEYGEGNFVWECKICGNKLLFRYDPYTNSAQLAGYAMECHENKYHGYNHDLNFWGLTTEEKNLALSIYNID